MCRLYGFRSSVLSGVHSSLVAAENALAQQSVKHPDGWGIAYYTSKFPHLIRSEKQALEDGLLREISAVVSTRTLLAHIRQATAGKVSVLNCHPFQYGPWTFAHNGTVAGFERLNDRLAGETEPTLQSSRKRTTDSEQVFYWLLSQIARAGTCIDNRCRDVAVLAGVVASSIRDLAKCCNTCKSKQHLNKGLPTPHLPTPNSMEPIPRQKESLRGSP